MPIKRCNFLALILSFFLAESVVFGQAAHSPSSASFSPDFFVVEIRGLRNSLKEKKSPAEIAALRDSLPSSWTVETPERTYTISTKPLRQQLTPEARDKALEWMEHLAQGINRSSDVSSGKLSGAQGELDKILAQSEFAAVRPPTPWELFRQRAVAWLERMLERLFRGMGRHPIAGEFLFWVIVVGSVVGIAFLLFRYLVSRDRVDTLEPSNSVINVRSWQEWIRIAREAAGRDDFREAVHSAYWAGIVRLEDTGIVPKDRSKTPREYLRAVADSPPGELLSRPVHRETLAALTMRLERVWYANRGATSGDFLESLRQLEALGCQLE